MSSNQKFSTCGCCISFCRDAARGSKIGDPPILFSFVNTLMDKDDFKGYCGSLKVTMHQHCERPACILCNEASLLASLHELKIFVHTRRTQSEKFPSCGYAFLPCQLDIPVHQSLLEFCLPQQC
mmetsp:Transcript_25485/g.41420  ORF Transcript_25485/g.41420 Transcript_25485/m.41420 type:complete len:124 (+) Transcript_25485:1607-1978(+)